jgi:hypothetical protein
MGKKRRKQDREGSIWASQVPVFIGDSSRQTIEKRLETGCQHHLPMMPIQNRVP